MLWPEAARALCIQWKNNSWSWLTIEVSINIWLGRRLGDKGWIQGARWAGQALGQGGWQWRPQREKKQAGLCRS